MKDETAVDRLTEPGGTGVRRLWAGTWDWPLVAIIVLLLGLVLFLTMGLWLPSPFPHY
jgi:hypothetical protein